MTVWHFEMFLIGSQLRGGQFPEILRVMRNMALVSIGLLLGTLTLAAVAEEKSGGKALYHVVSIKFKDGTTPEQIKALEDSFAALKAKIPGITSLHYGTNVSPENKNKGFTRCFVLTFASDKDRDTYLTHAEHKAFGKNHGAVMADVIVIDFWSQD